MISGEGDRSPRVRLPGSIKDWVIAALLFAIAYGVIYGLMAIPE